MSKMGSMEEIPKKGIWHNYVQSAETYWQETSIKGSRLASNRVFP